MAYAVGQQLGNYRIVRLLGQGGFAEVYLGEHVRLNMKAAIKVLHTHLSGEAIDAFQHEAQVIADLTHPNIVRVFDFDLQDGRPFLVLDYAPNGSLLQKHPRGSRVPVDQVVSYVKQIAAALQYAHERKLIHRDVKPENMLVGKQGEILLSDFGIVTMAHSTSSMNTQASKGTLAYIAPEQIQGKPRPASDQYALAVVVYQWLCGTMPFHGSSTEIIAQHLGVTPPPLREKVPDIPPGVEWVVMKALSKAPRARFASVQAFARELEQAANQAAQGQVVLAKNALSTPKETITAKQSIPQPAPIMDLVRPAPEKDSRKIQSRPKAIPTTPASLSASDYSQQKHTVLPKKSRVGIGVIGTCLATTLLIVYNWGFLSNTFFPLSKGNGTIDSPYRLSASSTDVQPIGIALAVSGSSSSNANCPTPTVVSLQHSGEQTRLNFSWRGLDSSQRYQWTNTNIYGPNQDQIYQPTSTSSLYVLSYGASPQARQQWFLNPSVISNLNQTAQQMNYCTYNDLYLQF